MGTGTETHTLIWKHSKEFHLSKCVGRTILCEERSFYTIYQYKTNRVTVEKVTVQYIKLGTKPVLTGNIQNYVACNFKFMKFRYIDHSMNRYSKRKWTKLHCR